MRKKKKRKFFSDSLLIPYSIAGEKKRQRKGGWNIITVDQQLYTFENEKIIVWLKIRFLKYILNMY